MKHLIYVLLVSQLFFVSFYVLGQSNSGHGHEYLAHLYDRSVVFDTASISLKEHDAAGSANAWKKWRIVENYSYGKNRGSLPMIADTEALHPFFRDKVRELIRLCEAAGITLAVVESYRTPAKQAEYYAMGSKYTSSPGGKSRHQYGLAVDVVPIVDSVAVWNNARLWRKIGLAGERLGLRWGGRWRVLYDPGHFEWSGGLTQRDLAQGRVPEIPSSFSGRYPHLEEDLRRLQAYWKAWEVEQSAIANRSGENRNEDPAVGVGN